MLGEKEVSGGCCDFDLPGGTRSVVEGFLEPFKGFKRGFLRTGDPVFAKGLLKSRGIGEPGRDGGATSGAARTVTKRQTDGEVVGEGGPGGPDGVVGGVVGDVDHGVEKRMGAHRGRGQESVNARRPVRWGLGG